MSRCDRSTRRRRSTICSTDPLCSQEWWWGAVHAFNWTPPGPGVPVTMIDSGTDLTHEEFPAGRTRPRSTRRPSHPSTWTSSTAPPVLGRRRARQCRRARRDLSACEAPALGREPRRRPQVGDEIAGLSAAVAHGPGVINLSLGGTEAAADRGARDPVRVRERLADRRRGRELRRARAIRRSTLRGSRTCSRSARPTKAAASPPSPAPLRRWTSWRPARTSRSRSPAAFNSSGYAVFDGTSFSAPLTSGAAAGVWTLKPTLTNTQLFDIMRHSASGSGWSRTRGYGALDVAAAVTRKAPAPDQQEPNEDVFLVKPGGLSDGAGHRSPHRPESARRSRPGSRAATTPRTSTAPTCRRGEARVNVRTNANVDLEVWGSAHAHGLRARRRGRTRDLLGLSAHAGARPSASSRSSPRSTSTWNVFLGKKPREAGYRSGPLHRSTVAAA